jgi:hypothetical protein
MARLDVRIRHLAEECKRVRERRADRYRERLRRDADAANYHAEAKQSQDRQARYKQKPADPLLHGVNWSNEKYHRPGADGKRFGTETSSPGSVHTLVRCAAPTNILGL